MIAGASAVFAVFVLPGIAFINWALALIGVIAAVFVTWILLPRAGGQVPLYIRR